MYKKVPSTGLILIKFFLFLGLCFSLLSNYQLVSYDRGEIYVFRLQEAGTNILTDLEGIQKLKYIKSTNSMNKVSYSVFIYSNNNILYYGEASENEFILLQTTAALFKVPVEMHIELPLQVFGIAFLIIVAIPIRLKVYYKNNEGITNER